MQRPGRALILSATDISNSLACRHRTALDFALVYGLVERPTWVDPMAEVLRERGLAHERQYVESLAAESSSIVDLRDDADAASRTLQAMRNGVEIIVQAKFEHAGWLGYADILRRVDEPSDLGPWSYEVYDTKLARDTRGGTILQLAAYSDLVAHVQGRMPSRFHVVTPGLAAGLKSCPPYAVGTFRVEDYAAYYRLMRGKLLDALALEPETLLTQHYPELVQHCEVCRWWQRCNARRRRDDHLSFIAGITRLHRTELVTQRYDTLAKAAAIVVPIEFKPSRGSKAVYQRVREQARVQLEQRTRGTPVYELLDINPEQGLCRLPAPSPGDLFLDLEGDPFARDGGREYLFGIWRAPDQMDGGTNRLRQGFGGQEVPPYTGYWAFDDGQERAAFEAVIDLILDRWSVDPGMHVYHFGHYEPAAMKRLMGRYATRAEALDRLLRGERFVDLHAVVRHALRAGVESYSIKKLEPFYQFTRDVNLNDAAVNQRTIELALESQAPGVIPDTARTAVEGYNRDDCRSTLALRDWLEILRWRLEAQGTRVPRPAPAEEAPSEKVSDLDAEVEELRAQLLDGVPAAPADRNAEQQVRWMLAYLIDWHRRESKANWWEFFRLCELPEEELLDEPLAIAELVFAERVHVVTHKKTGKPTGSVVDRYRYPTQDVEIGRKGRLKLQDGTMFGEVVAIDRESCLLDVKKGPERAEVHPTCVFAASVVPTETLQRAVMRVAADVMAGVTSSASDLLFRRTPRLRSQPFLQRRDESAVTGAVRIVSDLDRTTLAIQGPPGAGKTYAGAVMICALADQGLRVGVTAVSHKVIRNLLDAVQRKERKEGVALRVAQKVSEERTASGANAGSAAHQDNAAAIREILDNEDALAALASREVNVLGATAWLWSREDAANAVDVLFVDEAGQMSLASVLAVAPAARNLVLLGDPRQLEQPQKASHPDGIGISALDYLLDGAQTMPPDRGLFLPSTWRLSPAICAFTSEMFYERKLVSKPGLERQALAGAGAFDGAGLWWVPIDHEGNQHSSPEEVEEVARIVETLLDTGARWIDEDGVERRLTAADFRIVAPYNAQVNRLKERLSGRVVPVGTVDKFQGQEAPVVIYSMTSSSPQDAPRGMEFLYSLNRLNVATSRARCAAILVASPRLFEPECRTPRQMQLANALCRYREMARRVPL